MPQINYLKTLKMKKLFITLVSAIAFISCKDNNESHVVVKDYQPSTVSVTPEVENLGDNLNLQALGELVKNSTSAQDIEDKLNQQGSINNLDLNGDGSVDYIKVTEYGDGNQRGFSFTVELPNNESQEIATIEIKKGSSEAQMNIQGNQQLYGNNHYYQSHYSLTDLMIMSYLFTYHRPYYSPYHYGYYPNNYRSYRSTPYSSYRTRMATTTKTTRITRSTPSTTTTTKSSGISSPNANKASSSVTARAKSMAAPTKSQKSFTTTSTSRQKPTTSGFGNKNRSTTSSSSKPRSSSSWGSSSSSKPRSSGSNWGSSSSSRKSSGSSWGSSSKSRSSSSSSRSSSSRSSSSRSSSSRR